MRDDKCNSTLKFHSCGTFEHLSLCFLFFHIIVSFNTPRHYREFKWKAASAVSLQLYVALVISKYLFLWHCVSRGVTFSSLSRKTGNEVISRKSYRCFADIWHPCISSTIYELFAAENRDKDLNWALGQYREWRGGKETGGEGCHRTKVTSLILRRAVFIQVGWWGQLSLTA